MPHAPNSKAATAAAAAAAERGPSYSKRLCVVRAARLVLPSHSCVAAALDTGGAEACVGAHRRPREGAADAVRVGRRRARHWGARGHPPCGACRRRWAWGYDS